MMMNLDTLEAARNAQRIENALQAISVAIAGAWQTVTGVEHDGIVLDADDYQPLCSRSLHDTI